MVLEDVPLYQKYVRSEFSCTGNSHILFVNVFALLINPGVMSGLHWLLSISPKRVSSLSTTMKYSAPSFVQILESCLLCHYFEISCRDKPLKIVLKHIGLISSCSHSCLQCISVIKGRLVLLNWTTKQVDILLLIIHLSMIFVFHHRGHFYKMNTLHCLDDG